MADRLRRYLQVTEAREVRVYSYDAWLIPALLELRAAENTARAIVMAEDEVTLLASYPEIFADLSQRLIGGRFAHIELAVDPAPLLLIQEASRYGADRSQAYSIAYLAASTLMSLVMLWNDIADRLVRAFADEIDFDDMELHHLKLASIPTIYDALTVSHVLYKRVERALQDRSRRAATDLVKRAADDDAAVAALNAAGCTSLGLEMLSLARHPSVCGLPRAAELAAKGEVFRGIDRTAVERAAKLVEGCYREHMLVARNLAFMAVQMRDGRIARKLEEHIARTLQVSLAEVWQMPICGRRPLVEEGALSGAFQDGTLTF
jgi:hypothetical protein